MASMIISRLNHSSAGKATSPKVADPPLSPAAVSSPARSQDPPLSPAAVSSPARSQDPPSSPKAAVSPPGSPQASVLHFLISSYISRTLLVFIHTPSTLCVYSKNYVLVCLPRNNIHLLF